MKIRTILFALVLLPLAVLAQPQFTKSHGLYTQTSINVGITANFPGAEIRYTTDGSTPTAQSRRYGGALTFKETTLLRAVEVLDGEVVSPVATASYIFMHSVLNQSDKPAGYPERWGDYATENGYAIADYGMDPEMTGDANLRPKIEQGLKDLPILSIVTDKDNLFSFENDTAKGGIYIFTGPPVGDPTGHGWTRQASAELIGGPMQHDMSINCGLRLHGGHGRLAEKNPKHSMRLVFKKEYGAGKLEYPLFGEGEPAEFDQLVLRCHFGNSWQHWLEGGRTKAQYSRDMWARRMQRRMGHTAVNGLYVHVFLNGMYWGLYNIAERVDDLYGKMHFGGKKSEYDVVKIEESGGNHIEAAEGDLEAWDLLTSTVSKASDPVYYNRLQGKNEQGELDSELEPLLDIDAFIDYLLINQYGGNTDWDHHNWYAIRRKGPESKGFKFLCWDTEQIFENERENIMKTNNYGCPTGFFHSLLQNREFASRYVKRAEELLSKDGFLGQKSTVEVWDSLYNTIANAVYVEAARWGDYRRDVHPYQSRGQLYTVDGHYLPERNRLLNNYFPGRSEFALEGILAFVESQTGYDGWEMPDGWVEMTVDMFHQWDGTGKDAKPTDDFVAFELNKGQNVGGGGVVAGTVSVAYNQYADISGYDKLVVRGTGNNLRILANRNEDHGPYKQITVSFNQNDPYWNEEHQAIIVPISDIANAPTNENVHRPDPFVHLNAMKVAFGGSSVNVRGIYLVPSASSGINDITAPAISDGKLYNLNGVEVNNPKPGIYIRNGKKIIIMRR